MRTIPITAVPSQTLSVILDRQPAQIMLRQNGASLYLDLRLDGTPIVLTRICRDRQLILTDAQYRGFRGQLMFVDLQGTSDPVYTGLGTRFVLVYLAAGEVPDPLP